MAAISEERGPQTRPGQNLVEGTDDDFAGLLGVTLTNVAQWHDQHEDFMATHLHWLSQFLNNPRQVAAISPASRALGDNIAKMALDGLPDDARVIEVGCGFGSVTRSLLAHGLTADRLVAIDLRRKAVEETRKLGVRAWQVDARYTHFLARDLDWGQCDCVVSSLGLLTMPETIRQQILDSFHRATAAGGRLVQYTYGTADPTRGGMESLGWRATGKAFTWKNLPPAHIWQWTKPANA